MMFDGVANVNPAPASKASEGVETCDRRAEHALLLRALAGEADAARRLTQQHLPRTLSLATRLLGDPHEAEDIAQETFVRLWRYGHRWDPQGSKLSTWLHQITLNLCRDRIRGRRHHDPELLSTLPSGSPGPGELSLRAEQAHAVHAAIERLPDRQREALMLCHFEGMGNIEAAAALQISVRAVESLLGRARRSLRQWLNDTWNDAD